MRFAYMMLVLILDTGLGTIVAQETAQRVRVKAGTGSGVSAYIAVEKQAVQDKLDVFNNREVNGKRGPKLYLPTKPVFEDILTTDHHVIYFDVGLYDFSETHGEPSLSFNMPGASIFIPFLANHPDGVPRYSLDMGEFYDKNWRDNVARGEAIFPYFGLDEVTFNEANAVLRNGSDELRISFVISNPCEAPPSIRRHEFDVFIEEEFSFSFWKKLDLSWCDHHSVVEGQSCNLKSIKSNLEETFPNVCQFALMGSKTEECQVSFTITNITQGFRDLLLLNNGPINVVASESIVGDYYAYLKYPCIE